MPTKARQSEKTAPTAKKIREYILGRQQLKIAAGTVAAEQTPGEAIDEMLEQEESRRIRALAPNPNKPKNRL